MIKLINILSEIKITGKVTPEMIHNLNSKIVNYYWDMGGSKGAEIRDIFNDIRSKYLKELMSKPTKDYYPPFSMEKFKLASPTLLKNFYKDMLEFCNKYNIK